MSREPISRSDDLKRLQDEGYEIEIRGGHLLVKHVPYVNSRKEVKHGVLVSALELSGDVTVKPTDHVATFSGEAPCDMNGQVLQAILHSSDRRDLGEGVVIDHTFSSKPAEGYSDYYDKMTTYVNILTGPAAAIDPSVTARTFPVIEATEDESVFRYIDTASSRARIGAISQRLEGGIVAIVGLGGTGAYILDLVAKTPVREIHLFDGDRFSQHNAFRSPGAASIDELRQAPQKVAYLQERYSRMHRGIVAHDDYLTGDNVEVLRGMGFVFVAIDDGEAKATIVEALEAYGVPFVDVGMGIYESEGSLAGLVRVTTSTPGKREHIRAKNRIPFSGDGADDEYAQNIQIADLNALNAALAVIKWKKLAGFYRDLEREHHAVYEVDGNTLINEDKA
jgi:ThiF family